MPEAFPPSDTTAIARANTLYSEPKMADDTRPQVYLSTPPAFELSTFPARLAEVLDAFDVACVRLSMATSGRGARWRAPADALRRDLPRGRRGFGDRHARRAWSNASASTACTLLDGARTLRAVRKTLGAGRHRRRLLRGVAPRRHDRRRDRRGLCFVRPRWRHCPWATGPRPGAMIFLHGGPR